MLRRAGKSERDVVLVMASRHGGGRKLTKTTRVRNCKQRQARIDHNPTNDELSSANGRGSVQVVNEESNSPALV